MTDPHSRPDPTRTDTRLRASAGVVTLGVAAAVVLAMVGGVLGTGNADRVFTFLDGKAWLPNHDRGSVALVDGATGRPEFEMRFQGAAGDDLQVVQGAEGVFVLNRTTGEITRIDQRDMDTAGSIDADQDAQPLLAIGGGKAYVVLRGTGRVQQIDPESSSMAPIGAPVELGGAVSSAVVDTSGRLAVAQPGAGRVSWIEGAARVGDVTVGEPADALRVSLVDEMVVAIDHNRSLVAVLSPTRIERSFPLDLPTDGELEVADAMTGDRLWALHMPSAKLAGLRMTDGASRTLELSFTQGHALGGPLPNGRFVYVPDLDDGSLLKVDAETGAFVDVVPVAAREVGASGGSKGFDAFVKDGKLWGNDPQSDRAVVIDRDGNVEHVEKYRPGLPSNEDRPDGDIGPTTTSSTMLVPTSPSTSTPRATTSTTVASSTPSSTVPPSSVATLPPAPPGTAAPPPPAGGGATPPPPSAGTPSAPGGASASPGDRTVTVSWLPALANGSPITAYEVLRDGAAPVVTPATTTATDVTGLTNGTPYTFRVRAVNAMGPGPEAAASPATPAAALPGTPTDVVGQLQPLPFPSDNPTEVGIAVSWTAPATGGAVATYTVGCRRPTDPTGITVSVPGTLTNTALQGFEGMFGYRCYVEARNGDGQAGPRGETDPDVLLYPFGRPDAPAITSPLEQAAGAVAFDWSTPADDGGRPIVWYTLCVDGVGAPGGGHVCYTIQADSSSTGDYEWLVNLSEGTYTVTLVAVNREVGVATLESLVTMVTLTVADPSPMPTPMPTPIPTTTMP